MIGPFAWSPKGTVRARAFLMARALVQRHHTVMILIPPYDNPAHCGYRDEREGVQLVNVRLPGWGDSALARLVGPWTMVRETLDWDPDVVHVFKPTAYAGVSGIILRLLRPKLPLVLDCDDIEGKGGWAEIKGLPVIWRTLMAWQERWLTRNAHVVSVASKELESRAVDLGQKRDRVLYLPNGPGEAFQQAHVPSSQESLAVRESLCLGNDPFGVYIGHITYGSEIQLLVKSLSIVRQLLPRFRIVIIGQGPGTPTTRQQVTDHNLEANVRFAGQLDEERTATILASADLALYPHDDSPMNRAKSPSKIAAYMAMGKPVVASAVGEAIHYLDQGRAGILVTPGDAGAFAEAIIRLLKKPQLAAELGEAARQRISERYDWHTRIGEIERVYRLATEITKLA
jgi:glycosyltransferase involved in cell wall biosynthesis